MTRRELYRQDDAITAWAKKEMEKAGEDLEKRLVVYNKEQAQRDALWKRYELEKHEKAMRRA